MPRGARRIAALLLVLTAVSGVATQVGVDGGVLQVLAAEGQPLPPAPPAPSKWQWIGFSPGWQAQTQTGAELDSDLLSLRLPGRWMRAEAAWSKVQAAGPTSWDWSGTDAWVQRAHALGYEVILVLDYTPGWAVEPFWKAWFGAGSVDDKFWVGDDFLDDFAAFVSAAYQRYGPGGTLGTAVRYYEIDNEPNHDMFMKPWPSAAVHVKRLAAAYGVLHAYPGVKVITGGTAPAADVWNPWLGVYTRYTCTSWYAAIRAEMSAAGGPGIVYDHVGHHPYAPQQGVYYWNESHPEWNAFLQSYQLGAAMQANGDLARGARVFGTEAGVSTSGTWSVSEADQGVWATQYLDTWLSEDWKGFVGPFIWYSTRDLNAYGQSSSRADYAGVLRKDGTPKPIVAVLESIADDPDTRGVPPP